jgi:hypothetical protein
VSIYFSTCRLRSNSQFRRTYLLGLRDNAEADQLQLLPAADREARADSRIEVKNCGLIDARSTILGAQRLSVSREARGRDPGFAHILCRTLKIQLIRGRFGPPSLRGGKVVVAITPGRVHAPRNDFHTRGLCLRSCD